MKPLYLLLALVVSACGTCYQLPLSAADRVWMAAYPRTGQTITLRSSRGHTLRYTVAERIDTYNNLDCNWLEVGRQQPAHFHVTLRPVLHPEGGTHDLTLYVVKWNEQQPATLDFRVAGLEAYFHQQYDEHHFALLPQPCTLARQAYPHAFYFAAGHNAIDYGAAKWRNFYWDPQVGLLRLEAPDGEAFELVKE